LTIRSTAEAIASARSAPRIFVFLCRPFHVGFTKDVAKYRAYGSKGGGTTGVLNQGVRRVGEVDGSGRRAWKRGG
jgi:hypothetical protein